MEMKEYKAPEMEVVEMKVQNHLLEASGAIAPDPTQGGEEL